MKNVLEEREGIRMNALKVYGRRVKHIVSALVLTLATIAPSLAPQLVSAAAVTERSIELSNSSAEATDVTYTVSFKATGAAEAFVVDFCSNTPLIGQACTPPSEFDATEAASATVGFTGVSDLAANTVRVTGTIAEAATVTVELSGIDNPETAGPLYARIVTYDTEEHADEYAPTALGAGVVDQGSVAISITNTIGVSGAVLESMIFCVSGGTISADCAGTTAPVLVLGETEGGVKALSASAVSTGTIHTQISTNAVSGAVVRLKSSAAGCGGLKRAGAPLACDIAPAQATDISAGQAKFGLTIGAAATNTGTNPTGTFQAVSGSGYNSSTYALNYDSEGEATGVTSEYGDPFLDTNNAPVNNKNMAITFGASISNSTPAGAYSANLSLIATGKF